MKTDIERIKDLLFGNEKKALDAITRRLETPEGRTADVADVLPDSIIRSHAGSKRLVPALQEPVEECIRTSIRRDPSDFADALFPVMGPAIRRSIAEALRSMVQSLNEGIENSLSVTTRYKAWRAGMPLGQYVLQRSILYRVEQVYLIKRDDGLLIEHLQRDDAVGKDSDAVSAMYTAIQDFINDSFAEDGGEPLTTAVLGDLALWAVHGPHASLVCVIHGVAQAGFRTRLREVLEQVHLRYGEALSRYDGEGQIPGVETELHRCLELEQRKEAAAGEGSKVRLPWPALLLLAGLLVLAGWFWFSRHVDAQRIDDFRQALNAKPGIVVNQIERDGGVVSVRGLRDPLSESPEDVAPAFMIDPTELKLDLAPYQSLDAEIIERRARRLLKPPRSVKMMLDGSRLRLSGNAPFDWTERVQSLALAIPGIDAIDINLLVNSDDELLARLVDELQPPEGVALDVKDGVLSASGIASQAWILEAQRRLPSIAGVKSGDLLDVEEEERVRLAELLSRVDNTEVFFTANDILLAGQDAVLDRLAAEVRQVVNLAAILGATPQIRIKGYSDGLGTAGQNRVVEIARADRVAQWLISAGVSPGLIQTQATGLPDPGEITEPGMRRAEVEMSVVESR